MAVFDNNSCNLDLLAVTFPDDDDSSLAYIRNNSCLVDWDGGYYAAAGRDVGRTRASRKRRMASHEVGHTLGFRHYPQDAVPCRSLMSVILSDRDPENCTGPRRDDVDIYLRWNY